MAGMPYPPNLCTSVQSVGVFVGGYGIPAIPTPPSEFLPQNPFQVCLRKSSHGIHGIHRSFRWRIFSHGFHRIHRSFWRRRASHRFHRCAQMVRLRRLLWEDSLVPPLMDNLWVENKKMELNGIVVSIFFVSLPREYPNITN